MKSLTQKILLGIAVGIAGGLGLSVLFGYGLSIAVNYGLAQFEHRLEEFVPLGTGDANAEAP